MINYIEKGPWLHDAIRAEGHKIRNRDGVWITSDDSAVQLIIDAFDPLPYIKNEKIEELKAEALSRINLSFPAINSSDEIQFYAEFWLSINPSVRQPTANFQKVIDIYQAAKSAANDIEALSADVLSYDVKTTPSWP